MAHDAEIYKAIGLKAAEVIAISDSGVHVALAMLKYLGRMDMDANDKKIIDCSLQVGTGCVALIAGTLIEAAEMLKATGLTPEVVMPAIISRLDIHPNELRLICLEGAPSKEEENG